MGFEEFKELILGSWANFLPNTSTEFAVELYNTVNKLRINYTIYPEQENIFRIFKDINPDKVKVVILGQDPYHDGNATGVAFACKNSISPSLKQIWSSIKKDTIKEYEGKASPSLNHLTEQGVFLLNSILTVQEGQPLSHKYLQWERFTISVISELSDKIDNIVFMLWGTSANKYKQFINNRHLILEDTHPQYANYQDKEWNCVHFSKCNNYLKEHNIKPIKWQ